MTTEKSLAEPYGSFIIVSPRPRVEWMFEDECVFSLETTGLDKKPSADRRDFLTISIPTGRALTVTCPHGFQVMLTT